MQHNPQLSCTFAQIFQMRTYWNVEALAWLFTLLFCVLILGPIYLKTGLNYGFYIQNAVSVFVFLTFARLLFLLRFTPYARSGYIRFLLIAVSIPLFLYQLNNLYDFQRFMDEEGTISFFKGEYQLEDYQIGRFIRYQFVFFSVASLVSIAAMPVRMVISFWRTTNTPDAV
jgi:hypothetical protein